MKFEWDDIKNIENQEKHGISFEEATELFYTEYTIEFDAEHSTLEEDRYIATGMIQVHGYVLVVFCEKIDDLIRIISARKV